MFMNEHVFVLIIQSYIERKRKKKLKKINIRKISSEVGGGSLLDFCV